MKNIKRNLTLLIKYPESAYPLLTNVVRSLSTKIDYSRKDGESFNPKSISIVITKSCNLRCKMCHYAHSEIEDIKINPADIGTRMIKPENIERIVNDWRGPKPYITLTGGEPTLHPDLPKIIRIIKKKKIPCLMVSNGALLEEKAEEIIDAGLDILICSIDGDRDTHDRIRGVNGTFDKSIAAMKKISKLKKKKKKKFPLIFLNFSISNENFAYLDKIVQIANDIGIDGINFQHLWMQTDDMNEDHNRMCGGLDLEMKNKIKLETDSSKVSPEQLYEALQRVRNKHSFINIFPDLSLKQIETYYKNPEKFIFTDPSLCAWHFAYIQPDGKVTQCKELEMGDLNNATFQEIWNNAMYKNFRKKIKKLGRFPICARCCLYFRKM